MQAGSETSSQDMADTGKVVASPLRGIVTYAAFFMVGAGCGWFPVDAIINLLLNEGFDPHWMGLANVIVGVVGLCNGALYFAYLRACPKRLPRHLEQGLITVLIVINVTLLSVLAGGWQVGAPGYPVICVAMVLGTFVVNWTYFVVFPMIATHYGGWLVAPVRGGTDVSVFAANVLGQAQNPSGSLNLFPSWTLFLAYTSMALVGLAAWLAIVRFRICLRADAAEGGLEDAEAEAEGRTKAGDLEAPPAPGAPHRLVARQLLRQFRGLACPRSLLTPVLLGTLADLMQWGLVVAFSIVGAHMTDPAGCDGARGAWVLRTSTTLNRVVIPLGSVASSLAPCPRWLFKRLSALQVVASVLALFTVFGVGRDLWMTTAGQYVFIACQCVVGGLEAYLLTMAYRYVGDAEDIPLRQRHSASSLLGFLNIFVLCICQLITGAMVEADVVRCVDP